MLLVLLIHTTVMLTVTAQQNLTPFGTASQSSSYDSNDISKGKPENAVNPPISNQYSLDNCSSTKLSYKTDESWWMFKFSSNTAYITDITIYYRENYAIRMDGFKLYVTNTSTLPPVGYLCYEDPYSGAYGPHLNVTQTIPCNQLGNYVIYYDEYGSDEGAQIYDSIVELCYVAINGCFKGTWGTNCSDACQPKCIDQHCYPGNGSCVWGCDPQNCLNNTCDIHTGACSDGCVTGFTGQFCNKSEYFKCSNFNKSIDKTNEKAQYNRWDLAAKTV